MKKVESVLDGSLGWGKARTLATFPQIIFCLLSLILPKIFIIQRGEGGASASHPRVETLFKRLVHLNLTLPIAKNGGKMITRFVNKGVKSVILLAFVLGFFIMWGYGGPEKELKKNRYPNIVFILADNQPASAVGCYGNPDIKTTHIDQLAKEGIKFTNVYAANGVCSPTRATLMTGLMPSQHGVHDWLDDRVIPELPDYWLVLDRGDLHDFRNNCVYEKGRYEDGVRCFISCESRKIEKFACPRFLDSCIFFLSTF